MSVDPPFWFKQRQCKAEPHGGENTLRATGPNLGEAFLYIAPADGGKWKAGLRLSADGEDVASAELANPQNAWDAAFEMYRNHVIV